MNQLIKAISEFRKTPANLNPKVIYWPLTGKYFVSCVFTADHIQKREMEVIHG